MYDRSKANSERYGRLRLWLPAAGALCFGLLMIAGCEDRQPESAMFEGGSAQRGAGLIREYGCGSCHNIPGIAGATGQVGPPLGRIARRAYLGGVLPNQPATMVQWLLDPRAVAPNSAMPAVGLDEADARDIVAYLYTLK